MIRGKETPSWLAGARAGLLCLAVASALLALGTWMGPSGCGSESDVQAEALPPAVALTSPAEAWAAPASPAPPQASAATPPTPPTAPSGPAVAPDAAPLAAREVVLLEGKYEVPVVSDGRHLPPSPVTSAPGYTPPDDPEHAAVERGYRLADPNDTPLTGGAESAEWLARDLLFALSQNERPILLERRITFEEFAGILWPEMPQSRPVTNISAEDAWFFHVRTSVSAMDAALARWGGQPLTFTRLTFDRGLVRYPNYNIYHGVNIHALGTHQEEVVLKFARAFVEKDGAWKVFIYKD